MYIHIIITEFPRAKSLFLSWHLKYFLHRLFVFASNFFFFFFNFFSFKFNFHKILLYYILMNGYFFYFLYYSLLLFLFCVLLLFSIFLVKFLCFYLKLCISQCAIIDDKANFNKISYYISNKSFISSLVFLEENYLSIIEYFIVMQLFYTFFYDLVKYLNLEYYYLKYAHNRYLCFFFRFVIDPLFFEDALKRHRKEMQHKHFFEAGHLKEIVRDRLYFIRMYKKHRKEAKLQRKIRFINKLMGLLTDFRYYLIFVIYFIIYFIYFFFKYYFFLIKLAIVERWYGLKKKVRISFLNFFKEPEFHLPFSINREKAKLRVILSAIVIFFKKKNV